MEVSAPVYFNVSDHAAAADDEHWQRRRPVAARLAEECRERIEFVLGQVDLSEAMERRWLPMPELSAAERAKLEAVRVAAASDQRGSRTSISPGFLKS